MEEEGTPRPRLAERGWNAFPLGSVCRLLPADGIPDEGAELFEVLEMAKEPRRVGEVTDTGKGDAGSGSTSGFMSEGSAREGSTLWFLLFGCWVARSRTQFHRDENVCVGYDKSVLLEEEDLR